MGNKKNKNNKNAVSQKRSKKKSKRASKRNKASQLRPPRLMPGEVLLREPIPYNQTHRHVLEHYYFVGGDNIPFGVFKGEVLQVVQNKGLLIKRLYVLAECFDFECTTVEGVEDHVWIYDPQPFLEKNIKARDCVSFSAIAYQYKRKNGTYDYGLKECCEVEKISSYDLPDEEKIRRREAWKFIQNLICETCAFDRHCDGLYCLRGPRYLEFRAKEMFFTTHQELMQKDVQEIVGKLEDDKFLDCYLDFVPARSRRESLLACSGVNCMFGVERNGLDCGDRILRLDGCVIRTMADVKSVLSKHEVGDLLSVVVDRRDAPSATKKVSVVGKDEFANIAWFFLPIPY